MAFVVDQGDAFAKTVLPQRSRELKARVPRAHDQNWSLRHSVKPG
jgi:hypothetical protein